MCICCGAAGLQVTFADEAAALADCYTAAGPARCRQALMECLPLPEDTRYLALSEAVLERITARYGPVRVGFSGAMTAGSWPAMAATAGCRGFRRQKPTAF